MGKSSSIIKGVWYQLFYLRLIPIYWTYSIIHTCIYDWGLSYSNHSFRLRPPTPTPNVGSSWSPYTYLQYCKIRTSPPVFQLIPSLVLLFDTLQTDLFINSYLILPKVITDPSYKSFRRIECASSLGYHKYVCVRGHTSVYATVFPFLQKHF